MTRTAKARAPAFVPQPFRGLGRARITAAKACQDLEVAAAEAEAAGDRPGARAIRALAQNIAFTAQLRLTPRRPIGDGPAEAKTPAGPQSQQD